MSVTFKQQNTKASATKRLMKDLRELDKTPIPGLNVHCPDESNPFIIHCNVLINDGPYRGALIHLILHIPEDYPLTGPAGNIAPGLEFDSRYHGHIHEDGRHGHALCNDLLTNYASYFRAIDGGAKQGTGWSPGYTLSTALLQIVTFFADPDLHRPITQALIDRLHVMVKNFRCSTCGHSYDHPVPSILDYNQNQQVKLSEAEEKELKLKRELTEKLTCGVTKQNIFDDKICLGYPLLIRRDQYGRLWSEIVLELISYDAYVGEIQKSGGHKLDFYEHSRFRSVTGKDYNHWLPIYINPQHFEQSRTLIENSISIIYSGTASGTAERDFKPHMALTVLTSLMNKSGVQLFNGQLFESTQAIEAYCHFLRLLMHFIDLYPQLNAQINKTIDEFILNSKNRNKKSVPDIGEFLIQIALSSKYKFDDIKQWIYEEYFARQIYWIQKNGAIDNLLNIRIQDLSVVFNASKVSNHLLVFNLEMAQTFIFAGVKERLDQLYGFPPNTVVDRFQQRLKAIKALDRYSDFMQAIKMGDKIKTPEAMIEFIRSSVKVSNQQGYTNILSDAERQDQLYDQRSQNQRRQQQSYSRGYTRR